MAEKRQALRQRPQPVQAAGLIAGFSSRAVVSIAGQPTLRQLRQFFHAVGSMRSGGLTAERSFRMHGAREMMSEGSGAASSSASAACIAS